MNSKPYRFLLPILLLMQQVFAVQAELRFEDYIYEPQIRSVQFYSGSLDMNTPILFLNNQDANLTIEFDELTSSQQISDLWISVINCDADWNQSSVFPTEFMQGFTYDRIMDWTPSQNVLVPYMHYRHTLLKPGYKFNMSGNYLLKVYRSADENDLVLTRRFVVVETILGISPLLSHSLNPGDRFTQVNLSFDLFLNGFQVINPYTDIRIYIMQNYRWDNIVTGVQPSFILQDKLTYQFNSSTEFKGGSEFRRFDARSIRYNGYNIGRIVKTDSMYIFELNKDQIIKSRAYSTQLDMNGNFSVQSNEFPNADYEADYVKVRFSLSSPNLGDVFLTGKFADWRMQDAYKMEYNPVTMAYTKEIQLKQGIYDYKYIACTPTKKGKCKVDETLIEGSYSDTENAYFIFAYFRGPVDRTDRVIGFYQLGSLY